MLIVAGTALLLLPGSAGAQVTDPRCVPSEIQPTVLPRVIDNVAVPAPTVSGSELLPRTGSSLVVPIAVAVLLLCVGALLVVLARRRQSAAGVLVLVAVLGLVAGLSLGAAPASAQVDPCVATEVPAPIIPESPLAVLLPLSALALVAGAALARGSLARGASPAA